MNGLRNGGLTWAESGEYWRRQPHADAALHNNSPQPIRRAP
jgi:hypothetical protein